MEFKLALVTNGSHLHHNFELFKEISPCTSLGISYVVCKENIKEIEYAYELACKAGAKYFEVKMIRDWNSNMILAESQAIMLQLRQIMDYEVDGTKIICPIEFTDKCTEKKQRCWTSDLRAVITPEGMCRCTYSRGGNKMPLPETIEEFIMYRNILNKESVSNKECLFCTRKRLNSMVDKLINDSDYIKKIMESYTDEVIEDEEWI